MSTDIDSIKRKLLIKYPTTSRKERTRTNTNKKERKKWKDRWRRTERKKEKRIRRKIKICWTGWKRNF